MKANKTNITNLSENTCTEDHTTIAEQSGTAGNSSTQFSIEAENADSSYQLRNMTMKLSYLIYDFIHYTLILIYKEFLHVICSSI